MDAHYGSLRPLLIHYVLPAPVDWSEYFVKNSPLEVEIGFGTGEYLVRLAAQNPQTNFVGFEQNWERIAKTLRKIATAGLSNVRLLQVDARVGFRRYFSADALEFIHCLFPCPWPRKSQTKHRLFSSDFLKILNNRLRTGGQLTIVTDHEPYAEWITEQIDQASGFELKTRTVEPQYDTKFERKWLAEGKKKFYALDFVKTSHKRSKADKDQELQVFFVKDFNPKKFHFVDFKDGISIIFKDFIFDNDQHKALIHLIVCEGELTQHVWVTVGKTQKGWCIRLTEGTYAVPSQGVVTALEQVHQAVLRTNK